MRRLPHKLGIEIPPLTKTAIGGPTQHTLTPSGRAAEGGIRGGGFETSEQQQVSRLAVARNDKGSGMALRHAESHTFQACLKLDLQRMLARRAIAHPAKSAPARGQNHHPRREIEHSLSG